MSWTDSKSFEVSYAQADAHMLWEEEAAVSVTLVNCADACQAPLLHPDERWRGAGQS